MIAKALFVPMSTAGDVARPTESSDLPSESPMVKATTYTHEGVLYDVRDFRYEGADERRQCELNSPHAEEREFVPREGGDTRVYLYRGGINYRRSDAAHLAEQFRFAVIRRRR